MPQGDVRGKKVFLRVPREEDHPAFLAATRASRSLHRPWVSPPTTPRAYDEWLADGLERNRERRLLWDLRGERLLGYLAVNEIVYSSFQSGYLGYWAVAEHAGKGLMSEGLSLWIQHLFTRRSSRLHRLEANIQPENGPSIALVRSVGLRREGFSPGYLKVEGRWRDHERWAITVEAWRENRHS